MKKNHDIIEIAGELRHETDFTALLTALLRRKDRLLREMAIVRLAEKVILGPTGCWNWTGHISSNGYGWTTCFGRRQAVHRISYQLFIGPIPTGCVLDHLCRNRCCINPEHLDPVTQLENMRRGIGFIAAQMKRTACPKGHPLTGDNLVTHSLNIHGKRTCRRCRADKQSAYYYKLRDEINARRRERHKTLRAQRSNNPKTMQMAEWVALEKGLI